MIYKLHRRSNFTIVDNASVRDEQLTWKARGLLCYLLSLPDNWEAKIDDLAKRGPDGRHAVRSGLQELEQRGYIRRETVRDSHGQLSTITHVYERPQKRIRKTGV